MKEKATSTTEDGIIKQEGELDSAGKTTQSIVSALGKAVDF